MSEKATSNWIPDCTVRIGGVDLPVRLLAESSRTVIVRLEHGQVIKRHKAKHHFRRGIVKAEKDESQIIMPMHHRTSTITAAVSALTVTIPPTMPSAPTRKRQREKNRSSR